MIDSAVVLIKFHSKNINMESDCYEYNKVPGF